MTDIHRSSALRPTTPPQSKSPTSHYLTTRHPHPIPIQTANGRSNIQAGPLSPAIQNGSYAFDRVIKSGPVHRRMKKKGAWRSSWKPSYLVLRPNLLSVYKDQDESELRASITLSDVTAVAPVKKSNHDHVFGVFSPAKNYHFAGLSAKETNDWIAIIRIEARTESVEEMPPPSAILRQSEPLAGYETTDLSADDDMDLPGSPEVPHWIISGNKARAESQSKNEPRVASGLTGYSGNESFATSQSDFSDTGFSTSIPGSRGYSYLSSSTPIQTSALSPIPDDTIPASRPSYFRGKSNFSDHNIMATSQNATPKAMPRSTPNSSLPIPTSSDPNPSRVIRQGTLRLAKTISGVKQWKSIFVVLRPQSLSFHKSSSSSDTTPTTIIPINEIIEAAEIDRKKKQNCFQIICNDKTWKLATETEDELENWLGGLKSVLVKRDVERDREEKRGSRNASLSFQGAVLGGDVLMSPSMQPLGVGAGSPPNSREGEKSLQGMSGIAAGLGGMSLGPGLVGSAGASSGSRRVGSPTEGLKG